MLHPALLMLIRLQWRGGFRQFRQSLKTVRGLFHVGFTLALALYGIGSMYFVSTMTSQATKVASTLDNMQNDFLTLGLFGATCYVVLMSTGEATVYFTASEVAFLFPAPVTRKQLLTYKLLKSLIGILAISVFFSLFAVANIRLVVPRLIGTMLTVSYLQLLTMNVAFARQVMQEKVHLRLRQGAGLVVGVIVLFALSQMKQSLPEADPAAYLKAFQQSTAASAILAPFQVFTRMLRAPDLFSFIPYACIVLTVDAVLLVLAYRLDALSLEAAFAISERISARMKLMQAKGVWQAFGSTTSAVTNRRLPQLPFWAGIGPVVWQRMTTTFRSTSTFFWTIGVALLIAGGAVYILAGKTPGIPVAPVAGMVAMAYMSLLICLTMQNDIERVGFLKSLPLRTGAIVLGELLGFVVLLSAVQMLFILAVAGFFPEQALWLFCGASMTLPLNFLLFAIDKVVFYVYPTRLAKGAPGDFQNSGKQMVFIMLKMLTLGGALFVIGIAAVPGAVIFQSPVIAIACSIVVLLIECLAVIPLLSLAFNRFDPSLTLVS